MDSKTLKQIAENAADIALKDVDKRLQPYHEVKEAYDALETLTDALKQSGFTEVVLDKFDPKKMTRQKGKEDIVSYKGQISYTMPQTQDPQSKETHVLPFTLEYAIRRSSFDTSTVGKTPEICVKVSEIQSRSPRNSPMANRKKLEDAGLPRELAGPRNFYTSTEAELKKLADHVGKFVAFMKVYSTPKEDLLKKEEPPVEAVEKSPWQNIRPNGPSPARYRS